MPGTQRPRFGCPSPPRPSFARQTSSNRLNGGLHGSRRSRPLSRRWPTSLRPNCGRRSNVACERSTTQMRTLHCRPGAARYRRPTLGSTTRCGGRMARSRSSISSTLAGTTPSSSVAIFCGIRRWNLASENARHLRTALRTSMAARLHSQRDLLPAFRSTASDGFSSF